MASEGSERRVGKEIVQDKVQGEAVPFSFPAKSGEELRASALVFVECLIDHVFYLLDENRTYVSICMSSYMSYNYSFSYVIGLQDLHGTTRCLSRRCG